MGRNWTCGRCGVVASYGAGTAEPAQPDGWARHNGAWRCLKCRREDAMDEAATGTSTEQKVQRRRALTEFELRRDPDASDQLIAKRAGCSTAAVRPVRTALLKQETPPAA
ncbi:MAG: hypothetical protein AUG48_08410 [Actinobacteria bacterium 13_1_20CM_3_68_9]|nr:MAG: hypothetical protein AUG48_08410 [Actinobacteria bacterium 13_1_20CM_3_68_9]